MIETACRCITFHAGMQLRLVMKCRYYCETLGFKMKEMLYAEDTKVIPYVW